MEYNNKNTPALSTNESSSNKLNNLPPFINQINSSEINSNQLNSNPLPARRISSPNSQQFYSPNHQPYLQYQQIPYQPFQQQQSQSQSQQQQQYISNNVPGVNFQAPFSFQQPILNSNNNNNNTGFPHPKNPPSLTNVPPYHFMPSNEHSLGKLDAFQTSKIQFMDMVDGNVKKNSNSPKSKRIKISYNCVECRRRRVKCDKKSPCESCTKKSVTCVYDTQSQKKPKRYNKDSIIQRLSNQVNFYKELARKYTPKEEFIVFSKDFEDIRDVVNVKNPPSSSNSSSNHNSNSYCGFNDMQSEDHGETTKNINNVDVLVPLTFKDEKITKISNLDIFSDDELFSKENFLHFQSFNNINSKNNNNSDFDVLKFFTCLLNNNFNNNYQKKQTARFIQIFKKIEFNIEEPGEKEKREQAKNGSNSAWEIFLPFLFPGLESCSMVEDEIIDTPSPYLSKIIEYVNQILPSYSLMTKLKLFYYSEIYALTPCFEIPVLEDYIKKILRVNIITDKVTLNLEGTDIRNKIAYLSILFSILLISEAASEPLISDGQKNKNNIEKEKQLLDGEQETLHDSLFNAAIKLAASSNPLEDPTLHKLSAISELWIILTFVPESVTQTNTDSKRNADLLTFFIMKMARTCGINERSISLMTTDVKQLSMEDKSFINHCKKLVLSTAQISFLQNNFSNQTNIPLKIDNINKFQNFLIDTEKKNEADENIILIKNEETEENKTSFSSSSSHPKDIFIDNTDILDDCMFRLAFKKLRLLTLIGQCYNIFSGCVSLNELNEKISDLDAFVEKNCNIKTWKAATEKDVIVLDNGVARLNLCTNENRLKFNSLCDFNISLLKMYQALIASFQKAIIRGQSHKYNSLYYEYHFKIFKVTFDSIVILNDYSRAKFEPFIGKLESQHIASTTNKLFLRVLMTILEFICKIYTYKIYLHSLLFSHENGEEDELRKKNFEDCDKSLQFLLSIFMKNTSFYSKQYRFQYYDSFKICLFFDFFKKIYLNGSLFNYIFDTDLTFDPEKPLEEFILNHPLLKDFRFDPNTSYFFGKLVTMIRSFDTEQDKTEEINEENNEEEDLSDFNFESYFDSHDVSSKIIDSFFLTQNSV